MRRRQTALLSRSGDVKGTRVRWPVGIFVTGLTAVALGSSPGRAYADDVSYGGTWGMTALTESFVVQQWASPCGPPPVSGTMLPAGSATIQNEGGELVIVRDRRVFRTDGCLDPLSTLSRQTHSREARFWRTRCATPASDPRHAVVNTAYFLAPGDDAVSIAETGRYEFTIGGARCVADVKRAGSIARLPSAATPVTAASAPPAATQAPQPSAQRPSCSAPGQPARLEVRPSRKLLRLGEVFAFRGVVVDANGCPTNTPIVWTLGPISYGDHLQHATFPSIDASGRVSAPPGDFTEASFDVVASAAGREAHASVEATSSQDYEALLAQSGLDSNGERDEPAVAVLTTNAIGAPRARAEDGSSRRRIMFISIVGGLAVLLGLVAVIGARRARSVREAERAAEERHAEKMREYENRKRDRERQHADQMRAHIQSVAIAQQQAAAAAARGIDMGPAFCPSCRREYPAGTAFCAFDSNRLVAIAGHEDLLAGPTGGICPVCKRGFNPGVRICPHDGEELVPPVVANTRTSPAAAPLRGKICPTCGGRFDGTAAFCGKDGTQLVLLN
jgi:hypothetical protein